ncbi:hypothetical protein BaRGS_00030949 [Batillaria attramentaria]|uniref:Chitin-binding type-2 domain-containing protein n=1 Tax=Batillaria attramentaria TaxID=370345 RepID=A0ABD0JSM8_9CAEN
MWLMLITHPTRNVDQKKSVLFTSVKPPEFSAVWISPQILMTKSIGKKTKLTLTTVNTNHVVILFFIYRPAPPVDRSVCPADNGLFRDPDDCGVFWFCALPLGRWRFPCPPGTSFNQNYLVCDFPSLVSCNEARGLRG